MKTALTTLVLGCAALASTGCATVATAPHELAAMDAAEREVYGALETHEFGKQLQVRLPAKLAVTDCTGDTWDDTASRRLVQAVKGLAEDDDTYIDVVSVPAPPYGERATLESLRGDAAGHQADLQIVITRREVVRDGTNALSALKLLIVPMLFVPTEDDDVELTVRAIVRDVRNGLIYTTFDDHRTTSVVCSVAAEEDAVRAATDALYDEAVADLREALARKLPALERRSVGTR